MAMELMDDTLMTDNKNKKKTYFMAVTVKSYSRLQTEER